MELIGRDSRAGASRTASEPARPRRFARRTRIEQQPVRNARVGADRKQIGFRLDRQHLHHRKAEALSHRDALRRLVTVKLQHVGLERLDDAREQRIVASTVTATLRASPARGLRARAPVQATRYGAGWKEHEADHVGAGIERNVKRFGGGEAADFDDSHLSVRSTTAISSSSCSINGSSLLLMTLAMISRSIVQ